jgi:hypothetical protein
MLTNYILVVIVETATTNMQNKGSKNIGENINLFFSMKTGH